MKKGFKIVVAGVIGVYAPPESAIATKQECLVPLEKLTWQALKGIVAGLYCSWITATFDVCLRCNNVI